MRIIAGGLKSRRIKAPGGLGVRPTSDRVRESLFSVIEAHVEGARVLDLYAGAGTLGIEAASRGASHVTFVEKSREVAGILEENVRNLGLEERTTLVLGDCIKALEEMSRKRARFGMVFVDPPYSSGAALEAVRALDSKGLVSDNGIVVVEHGSREKLPLECGRLKVTRTLSFGETEVSIYRRD